MPIEVELPAELLGSGEVVVLPIPESSADMKLPDPTLIDYYRDRRDRKIEISGEITEDLIEACRRIMDYNIADRDLAPEDRQPIFVYIFSPGGHATAAYSFIAMIENSKTPIITVNMGMAYSAASEILLSGHKRYCLKRSQAMIHQGYGAMQGSFSEMEEAQKSYKKFQESAKRLVLEKTKIDEKLFNKNRSKDWWFTDEEQVEYGLVDAIVDSIDQIV